MWPLLVAICLALGLSACSGDPNVRKQKYFESGNSYFEEGKYSEAVIQYLNAIRLDPRFIEARYQLAQSYLRREAWSSAYRELSQIVGQDPDHLQAQIDLGTLFLAGRQFQQAKERADLVLEKNPSSVEGHILKANALAGMQDFRESLQEMQAAIRLDPQRSGSYLNLAVLQLNSQRAAEAEASFKKAVELDSKSTVAFLALGNFYMQRRRWSDAERQFQSAIEVEAKSPAPRAALARLFAVQGQPERAAQVLMRAKRDLPDNPEAYRLLGDFYYDRGEEAQALAEYKALYEEHPQDIRVKKNYVQLLILRDQLDEATRLNDEILKGSGQDVEGRLFRGQILYRRGQPNDAIIDMQSALRLDPENPVVHFHLGLAHAAVGNLGQAEGEWRAAVQLRPQMIAAHRALGELALRKGDMNLLQQSANELIAAFPSSPEGYVWRALAQLSSGTEAEIETDLQKAIQVAPQDTLGYSQLAGWRVKQNRLAEAERIYEQALARDPNHRESLHGLMSVYRMTSQAGKARQRLAELITNSPNNSELYLLQGMLLIDAKELEKAEAALRKAVALNPDNFTAYSVLGQVQVARGSLDQAVATYQRAIQENPQDARNYISLGDLEQARGNWQKAQDLYQKALQVQPDHPLAANNLAYLILERGGNADVALSLAQGARRQRQDLPETADTLAWAYYHKGVYASAITLLQEAVKNAPRNPTYHYHLGLAYQKSGDAALAKTHLNRALQIQPDFPKAAEARNALAQLR